MFFEYSNNVYNVFMFVCWQAAAAAKKKIENSNTTNVKETWKTLEVTTGINTINTTVKRLQALSDRNPSGLNPNNVVQQRKKKQREKSHTNQTIQSYKSRIRRIQALFYWCNFGVVQKHFEQTGVCVFSRSKLLLTVCCVFMCSFHC